MHPGAVGIKVKFNNKMDMLQVDSLSVTVSELKKVLQDKVGLAANKQKLQIEGGPWLKDAKTLAFYNVSANTVILVGAKERGGRKK